MRILVFLFIGFLVIACKETIKKEGVVKEEKKYKIAYNVLLVENEDNYEVFSMNIDGSNNTNITNLDGVEWTYNAFGNDLYVISDKDTTHRFYYLYRTDANGNSFEKVYDIRLSDSWIGTRNEGKELVIKPHKTVDTAFYIIDLTGKVKKKIKPDLAYFNDPHFSPDGKKIVFRGALKSFKKDSGYIDELYIINEDGTDLKQLTKYPVADTTSKWYNYHAGPPKWHPTENFISYQSRQNGKSSLFAVTPDGTKQWKLTQNDTLQQGWHSWSPDGKWLAIEVFDMDDKQFHIQLMNWETKATKILTDTTYRFQQAPVFVEID